MRLTSRQLVVRNSSTKFRGNPANGSVAVADERRTSLPHKAFSLLRAQCLIETITNLIMLFASTVNRQFIKSYSNSVFIQLNVLWIYGQFK